MALDNFVVLQNGQEIYRTNGISQVGSSAQTFTFTSAGQAIIKIENADNKKPDWYSLAQLFTKIHTKMQHLYKMFLTRRLA